MKSIVLITSVVINIILGITMLVSNKTGKSKTTINSHEKSDTNKTFEIASMDNFEKVFINRDDSVYKLLWNEAFENQPQSAFLISCSYYYVTKDKQVLQDIDMSISQIQDVYQEKMKINDDIHLH